MKRIVLFCLLAAAACAQVRAQSAPPPAADAPSVAAAEALVQSGKTDEALAMLATLAAKTPREPKVDLLYGMAYYRKGDYERAAASFTSAVGSLPQDSRDYRESVHLRGLSLYYLGRVKEALPDLERVVAWSPENLELGYALGLGYVTVQDIDRARVAFARIYGVAPDSAQAHVIVAQIMIHSNVDTRAPEELQAALALDPKIPEANRLLGEMAIFHSDVAAGIEYLRKEISLNPSNAMAHYRLGEALTRQQKWDEALAPLQRSIWLNPFFSGPFIVLGKVYMQKGDLGNAVDVLNRAVGMDPNNGGAHYLFGQVLQRAGRAADAQKEFAEAKRLALGDGANGGQ